MKNSLDLSGLVKNIEFMRKNIDLSVYNTDEIFTHYTNFIKVLVKKSRTLIFETKSNKIKNKLIFYQSLNISQEYLGQLRSIIGKILSIKNLSVQDYQKMIILDSKYKTNINNTNMRSLDKILDKDCVVQTLITINDIREKSLNHSIKMSPLKWFNLSTCAINSIHSYSNEKLNSIKKMAYNNEQKVKQLILKYFIFWASALVILIILFTIARTRSKELEKGQKLLTNYKQAIDHSSIVSKTDKRGVISYVNDSFCKISGYTQEELINKPHNIIRHPDMPKSAFKEMWDTIKQGKQWRGNVKNLKKDGTFYWVDASISPIYDEKGVLLEYIAIRHDITDIILLNSEIRETQRELIYKLGEAVESRSKESGNHVRRVAHYSKLLAKLSGLSDEDCETIFAASTMHDIGKISIPDSILLKPGQLDKDEWEIMKTHSEIGYKILKGSQRPLLKIAADVAYEHHEHYNGNGYPLGIKGEQISIFGRIVAIVDVFDALATHRIYKTAWPLEDILDLLKKESSKQFDPKLIELFLDNISDFIKIKEEFQDN